MKDQLLKTFSTFKTNLRQTRLLLCLTQKQVAEKIGITHQSYQAYESGVALPTLENFLKLCRFFDLTPNELLGID